MLLPGPVADRVWGPWHEGGSLGTALLLESEHAHFELFPRIPLKLLDHGT